MIKDADSIDQCLEDLLYIVDVKPSEHVLAFYKGCLPNNCWNDEAAFDYVQSLSTAENSQT